MQWFNHKFSLVNQVLRLFQIVGAIVCIVYYGKDLNAAAKQDKYVDSKWMYAVVTASMALITSFVYFVCGFIFEFGAIAIMAAWDGILTILWVAVVGIFCSMYLSENPEMDQGIKDMKIAAGFDLANFLLWLFTACIGVWRFFISDGSLLHTGRTRQSKVNQ